MPKLIRKSNVFHPLINGVSFTQSQCGTFSVSGDVTDEQAVVFLQLPDLYDVVGERGTGGQSGQTDPAPPAGKPETKKEREAREKAEREAAKKAEEDAAKTAETDAAQAGAGENQSQEPSTDSNAGGATGGAEDPVF